MERPMNNFSSSLEESLEPYVDSAGRPLWVRARRLSEAVDYIWSHPRDQMAIKFFNTRLAKFFRGINHNRLLSERVMVRAEYVKEEDDVPPEEDTRETIILDESRPSASFDKVKHITAGEPIPGLTAEVMEGLAIAILNFFVVQLFRRVIEEEVEAESRKFPANLYARVDNILAVHGKAKYGETVLPDRFRALQLMLDINTVHAADAAKVREMAHRLRSEVPRKLVLKEYIVRLRTFELYQKVRPFIMGERKPEAEGPDSAGAVQESLGLLMDYVCGVDAFQEMRQDWRNQVLDGIERPLACAIGLSNGDLGWTIYRGLRHRQGQTKFRSKYLFRTLLQNDQERLAVVNRIHTQKRKEIGPSHPDYGRVHEFVLRKYRPFFDGELLFDAEQNSLKLAEESLQVEGDKT